MRSPLAFHLPVLTPHPRENPGSLSAHSFPSGPQRLPMLTPLYEPWNSSFWTILILARITQCMKHTFCIMTQVAWGMV